MTEPERFFHELQMAMARRERVAINDILRGLIAERATLGKRWRVFAEVLLVNGELNLAVAAIDLYLADDPSDPKRHFARSVVLARAGQHDQAWRVIDDLRNAVTSDPQLDHFAGALASEAGEFALAEQCFLAVLGKYPGAGQTWLELSAIHRFTAEDPLLARLVTAAAASTSDPEVGAAIAYALGKALDDVGDVDRAFAAFDRGARLIAGLRHYDAAADRAGATDIVRNWSAATLKTVSPAPADTVERAIFVSGLPRSGTTLVEQILASNTAVGGGGELLLLATVAESIGGLSPAAIDAFNRRWGSLKPATDLYHHLLTERFGTEGRVVDKTLEFSRVLGMVASIMPKAPLIWLRRDPLDTAWSCLKTHFSGAMEWSWSQGTIAAHFRLDDILFYHWQNLLGDRLLIVPYEELVEDSKTWTARIEAHCGLPHDPATLVPHLKRRRVMTSSVAQVRQPISTRAVGSAQRYRKHLEPFMREYDYNG
jgi:tetratricopeptide (TPR) repeat protein